MAGDEGTVVVEGDIEVLGCLGAGGSRNRERGLPAFTKACCEMLVDTELDHVHLLAFGSVGRNERVDLHPGRKVQKIAFG